MEKQGRTTGAPRGEKKSYRKDDSRSEKPGVKRTATGGSSVGKKRDESRKPYLGKSKEGFRSEKPAEKSSDQPRGSKSNKSFEGKPKIEKDSTKPKVKTSPLKTSDETRLNKFLANAGICSRRDADTYIAAGVVSINGKIVTELGTKVLYGDVVKFNDLPIMPEKMTYVLLNKPKDYVTTLEDPHAKNTVIDLIRNGCKERVYPVGRLDKATTGLLLLTNDGELAEFLSHPRNNKKKIYQVTLDRIPAEEDLEKLYSGIELEDGKVKADEVTYCNPDDKHEIGVEIHSGANRVIRRMFEHLGYKVKKLDRVYYAGLTKKNLPRGKWRFLNEKEIIMLKRGSYS
jgi:23S rRNA pseudouridine2605 synthase